MKNKEEQKQHLIDIMRGDEELGLYEEPKQEIIMKTHWIGIIKWNDGTILRTEPFYKYDEGIKVWSSKFSFENTGKFEWIDYERVEEPKQERMYSKEDLRTAWMAAKNSSDFNEWFEQYKKK